MIFFREDKNGSSSTLKKFLFLSFIFGHRHLPLDIKLNDKIDISTLVSGSITMYALDGTDVHLKI
jgi:hypothetical protein